MDEKPKTCSRYTVLWTLHGRSKSNWRAEHGATLIEVLAVAVLLSLVGVAVYSVLFYPASALQRAQQSTLRSRSVWDLDAALGRDLASAVSPSPFVQHSFYGDSQSMQWVTRTMGVDGPLAHVRYEWIRDPPATPNDPTNAGRWVRTTWPTQDRIDPGGLGAVTVMNGVHVQLAYYDGEQEVWRTAWDDPHALPGAVRLEGEWAGEGETSRFSIVYPIYANRTLASRVR